jgi:Phosphotransferase enzyme family
MVVTLEYLQPLRRSFPGAAHGQRSAHAHCSALLVPLSPQSIASPSLRNRIFRFGPRPIAVDDFARDRRLGRMPTTALLQLADERIRSISVPEEPFVFVHGDLWPGNTIIAGARVHALIDWKTAGAGNPGVDLGELRKQVAIFYGDEAPSLVLEGWERASGVRAADVPYWDATAALNTPTESYSPFAAGRRDEFLRAAIEHL